MNLSKEFLKMNKISPLSFFAFLQITKKPKQWYRFFIAFVLLVIIFIVLLNFVINPYRTFSHQHFLNQKNIDKYSDRIKHFYISKHSKPSVIMMGTSRIGLYPSEYLSKYIDGRIYNSTLAGSSIEEQSAYLTYYIQKFNLKHIVWSLDFFSFNPDKKPYPAFFTKRLEESFYLPDYAEATFNFKTFLVSLKTIYANIYQIPDIVEKDQPFNDEQIHNNITASLKEYKREKMFLNSQTFLNPKSIDANLNRIKKVVALSVQNGIQLTIYISPVHETHLDMIESLGLNDTYNYMKEQLSFIHPYYDFGTKNSITQNFVDFRDSSHTVKSIGKLIFERIFDTNQTTKNSDFGVYKGFSNDTQTYKGAY